MSKKSNILISDLVFGIMSSIGRESFSYPQMVYLTEPFDVSPDTLRPTLMRMRRDKLIDVEKEGKKAYYSISRKGHGIKRNVASRFSPLDWSGWGNTWRGVLFNVQEGESVSRYRLRKKLSAYHFVCLEKGFWIRPYSEEEERKTGFTDAFGKEAVRLLSFQPEAENFIEETKTLWQSRSLNTEYAKILEIVKSINADLLSPREAYISRMQTGNLVIKMLAKDPLLPYLFLPENWKGDELRIGYFQLDKRLGERAEEYYKKLNFL